MAAIFKPKFWKPGSEESDWRADRTDKPIEDDTSIPTFFYQPNPSLSIENQRQRLPIFRTRNHIIYLIENYQTTIVVGETSCGKSTQIPQYLMEAGWCADGKMIGVTQPRRVAATTLASRVAEEKGCILGDDVGYSISFDDCWTPGKTIIKFMTEGILIREMMSDPLLNNYAVILVDEVHERSIDTDILLGLLKKISKRRTDLRLIVSSATVDADQLKDFFDDQKKLSRVDDNKVTIISIEGRSYPVEIYYMKEPVADYVKSSIDTVLKIHQREPAGDILVFLTGQEEVEFVVSTLRDYDRSNGDDSPMRLLVLPLYGALPSKDQLRVFLRTPTKTRKVVVTTNIAEASLTIMAISYVIDCGFVKIRHFNSTTATDSLVIVPVSKFSAEQRAGRAGRLRSGKVYRLYTESDFDSTLPMSIPPEMQRISLTFPILQLKALGIENILRFNFPAAPPAKNVISALEVLFALGALDTAGQLTQPLGLQMAEFPLNPFFSKMLLISGEFGCSKEVAIICSMLQVQNVFHSPPSGQKSLEARKARRLFSVAEGDLITLLNVYQAFEKNLKNKRWCDRYFLNYKVLLRAVEITERLSRTLKKFHVPLVSAQDVHSVCRCIAAGFFPNSAYLHHSGVYKTIRGDHSLYIHQNSVLYAEEKQPSWVVFNEVVLTSKEFMRDITAIDPQWLCELAPHYYQFGTAREIAFREANNNR